MKNILVFSLLILFSSSAFSGERLDGAAIKALLSNKTITGVHFKKGKINTFYAADGMVESRNDGAVRKGKWWVKDGKRCLRWTHKAKDFCHYIDKKKKGYQLTHGKKGFRIVKIKNIEDGNTLK